jgi:ribosomal protein S18 acetylase RimI-like enzyme
VRIRELGDGDRDGLEGALRSDETFRDDEVAVALELIDDALSGGTDYLVRVAEEETGRLAGYICFGQTPMTASTWDLYWIVVHRDARGRGVAGSLLRAMEEELRGRAATGIRVETSELESYGAARALYDRHGYPEAARLADFYRVGDGLIVYYKRL